MNNRKLIQGNRKVERKILDTKSGWKKQAKRKRKTEITFFNIINIQQIGHGKFHMLLNVF